MENNRWDYKSNMDNEVGLTGEDREQYINEVSKKLETWIKRELGLAYKKLIQYYPNHIIYLWENKRHINEDDLKEMKDILKDYDNNPDNNEDKKEVGQQNEINSVNEYQEGINEKDKKTLSKLSSKISSLMKQNTDNTDKYSWYSGLSSLLMSSMVTKDTKKSNYIIQVIKNLVGRAPK